MEGLIIGAIWSRDRREGADSAEGADIGAAVDSDGPGAGAGAIEGPIIGAI